MRNRYQWIKSAKRNSKHNTKCINNSNRDKKKSPMATTSFVFNLKSISLFHQLLFAIFSVSRYHVTSNINSIISFELFCECTARPIENCNVLCKWKSKSKWWWTTKKEEKKLNNSTFTMFSRFFLCRNLSVYQ